MQRLRALMSRLRRSPRALLVMAVLAVLLAAAVLDVPGRLGDLAPADSPAAKATPTPTVTTDPGRLINLKNAENEGLDRCTPGSAVLAKCGPAPALGDGTWLGGYPTRIEDLQGSVALVDFFSGSCINCRRDARYLNAWQKLYGPSGLRIIGIHTPEFDFEKDVGQLSRTLKSLSIGFPVLQDQAFATLTDYRSQVLPSKYLVDRSGTVRAITFGEGGYFRIEAQIRKLLTEGRPGATLPDPLKELDDGEDVEPGTTGQINLGESRGRRYDNESDTVVGLDTRFRLPRDQPQGTFSFGGLWRVGSQDASPREAAVARVSFRGRRAYQLVSGTGVLVVTSSDGTVRRIEVDGGPDLRQISSRDQFGPETLTVRYEGDLQVYAFSFG